MHQIANKTLIGNHTFIHVASLNQFVHHASDQCCYVGQIGACFICKLGAIFSVAIVVLVDVSILVVCYYHDG